MKQNIITLLSEALPAVDFESDFLFSELDSLGIVTILVILSKEYNISLDATDVTPRNFRSIDTIVKMVESKLSE
ncbi:MAG: acyl carrier protein [Bacteroidales bacterium]|jgi:acyl carrier protein|nr:acyl carrier protein [Bacteroidales bacterium]